MSAPKTREEAMGIIGGLMGKSGIAMLTTMTEDGRHLSRPMGLQKATFDGDVYFFAYEDSPKVAQIATHPQVNVSFSDRSSWVSLSGPASLVHDRDRMAELWDPSLKAWFADGLDTPGITLIKVAGESAEYWESGSNTAVTLFGIAKAALTGQPSQGGENHEVAL